MPPRHNKKKGFFGGKKSLTDFDSIQGILFTCNGTRQKEAAQEALGLVEQFGDKLVETSDTLQNDILEIMTKEREKQIAASKKKQERINARISREQGIINSGGVSTSSADKATANTTDTTNSNDNGPKEVTSSIEPVEPVKLETKSEDVVNNVASNEESKLEEIVEPKVEEQENVQKSVEEKPLEAVASAVVGPVDTNTETTSEVKEPQPTNLDGQKLTTWQLKEKNTPPPTGLDLATVLSCEYLETEVKIVKDGTKNYELLETGINGQLFVRIRNRAISPVAVCQKISKHFKKAYDNQEEISSRFLFKMFPICDMFQANENNLNNRFVKMIENKFENSKVVKYVVNIKSHHNNTLDKKIIYETLSHKIPNGSVELNNAGVEFHVFLMKGKCLLGMSTDCDIYNYNINAMRHISTQDEMIKENQRNASKRKANEILTETSLEVADMIEVENSKNATEPSEKEDETMEENTNPSSSNTTTEESQITKTEENDQEMYEFLEEPITVPLVEATVSLQVYSKRRKIENHPSIEFDDIKVI